MEQEAFFNEMVFKTISDSYHKTLFYTLGIIEETRDNIKGGNQNDKNYCSK